MLQFTGAILIGGESSRFGSPKHEAILPDGRTILAHVQTAVGGVCERVVLVDAAEGGATPIEPIIRDVRPNAGPLGGIEALLASGLSSHFLVCPCDVPLITANILRLLTYSPQSLATIFQVDGRDEFEPLPASIRAEALPIVRQLLNSQQRSVWKLMRELTPTVVRISEAQADALRNVNTREDFDEIELRHDSNRTLPPRG